LPNSSMTSYCSFLHKTDTQIIKGKIINKESCPVKFYHILPKDLSECPFIVVISVGIHNHPPPPPVKTPQNIIENLQSIINNEDNLDLTAHKLLTRVTYELLKQKNLSDPYIRTAKQTELFAQTLYAEIDMAFKRIHGTTNEWEICAYINRYQKTLVFARVFTNVQSANAYQHLFEDLFTIVKNDTQIPFKFQHIHGSGLGCLIADEHQGLGQYLHSKYNYLSCEEHLQHIYKLCQIHFNRNIRNKAISNEIKTLMYSIPTLKTQEQVLETLTKIKKSDELGAA
ncbi:2756_t:CDS:2, partial [Dentiscutata heterogama]